MSITKPRILLALEYAEAAQAYLRSLPPEHFMEAIGQSTQRKITLESLDLVHARRPEVQVFNELLVQYPLPRSRKIGQVVPDNMVVIHDQPIKADGSFDVPLQPVGPFLVLEYVSKHNQRKDYEDNFVHYERRLKVPYYLLFYPDTLDLTLYHYTGRKYTTVKPNAQGRYAIPELELEVALVDGWVRFWFRGELLPLPAELQHELDEARRRADAEKRRADAQQRRADELQQQTDELQQRAGELQQQLEQERQARLAQDQELARLRAQLKQGRGGNAGRS